MRLDKTKPSTNFSDRTNPTRAQRFLYDLEHYLNPVTAYRGVRSELIKAGYLKIPGSEGMAREAERIVQERMSKRDELLAKGFTLEEAEAAIMNLR